MISRLPLMVVTLFILQCRAGTNRPPESNARGVARTSDADAKAQDSGQRADCAGSQRCQSYQDDDDGETVAVPPTSIAGAHLTCLKAADPSFLACQVQNENVPVRLPSTSSLDWTIATGADSVPATVRVHDGLAAGTYFYVKLSEVNADAIRLDVKEGGAIDTLNFALTGLPSEDTVLTLAAMPVDAIPPSTIESSGSFELGETLGNAVLSDENDSCLGEVDGKSASQTVFKDINYADDAGKVSLFADEICGLQARNVYMNLTAAPPAKRVLVKFVPNAKRLLMFKNLDFVPGPMTFTFGYLSAGAQDDVKLGSFTFVHGL